MSLLLLSLSLSGGCATRPRVTSSHDADALRSTVRGAYEAVASGDEAAYRRLVEIPPGDDYSDALTTTMFESIRLHQAVEDRSSNRDDANGSRSAPVVGESLASSRPSSLAAVDYRDNAQALASAAAGWTFTIVGDRATINELADSPSAPSLRNVRGRWLLAPTQWDTPRDTATYRLGVDEERALATALATARGAVIEGSARSVEDVNAILRTLLVEPATQPR